jgi:hypothetical protein
VRTLVYQAAHGLGVEMAAVDTAARLANALDARIALPLMPLLESTTYLYEVPDLFEVPDGFRWCRTSDVIEVAEPLGRVVKVLPDYLNEFCDAGLRRLHPTWVDVIENLTYFREVGFRLGTVDDAHLTEPMTLDDAVRLLGFGPHATIGCGYLNGLLPEASSDGGHDFSGLSFAPAVPARVWREEADRQAGPVDVAVHIRRGNLVPAAPLHGLRLPSLASYRVHLPTDAASRVYVATDDPAVWQELRAARPLVQRADAPDPLCLAAIEAAICSSADRFVGTVASTFSHLIACARERLGHAPGDTVLL